MTAVLAALSELTAVCFIVSGGFCFLAVFLADSDMNPHKGVRGLIFALGYFGAMLSMALACGLVVIILVLHFASWLLK
jgi:hypothetical protein